MSKGIAQNTVWSGLLAAVGRWGGALRVHAENRRLLMGAVCLALCLLLGAKEAHAVQDGEGNEIIPIGAAAGNRLDAGGGKLTVMGDTGNVGIGSSAPAYKLDVDGEIYAAGMVRSHVYFYTDAVGAPDFMLPSAGGVWGAVQNDAAGVWSLAHKASFDTSLGTPVLTWTSGGNIGIGSSAPSQVLDVIGTVKAATFVGDGSGLTGLPSGGGWTRTGTDIYPTVITDNVGIGSSAPRTKLDVIGTVTATAFIGDGSGLTGVGGSISGLTPGYHTKALTATTIGDSLVYDNGTNVGIGSSAPQAKLDVEGSVYVGNGNVGIGTSVPAARLTVAGVSSASDVSIAFSYASNSGIYSPQYNQVAIASNGNTAFFTDAGKVTIAGSTTPANALNVYGAQVIGTGLTGLGILAPANGLLVEGNVGIGTTVPQAKLDVEGNVYFGNGNVGIGSSNPTYKLDVNGTMNVLGDIRTSGGWNSVLAYSYRNMDGNGILVTSSQGKIVFQPRGDPVYFNTNEGNVGLNSSAPRATLDVEGNIYVGDAGVAGSGNIGVGTAVPAQKVEVVGTVKATAFIGDGSGLTGVSSSQWLNGAASAIYYSAGNVGIGTSDPTYQLHIHKTSGAASAFVYSGDNNAEFKLNAVGGVGQINNVSNDLVVTNYATAKDIYFRTGVGNPTTLVIKALGNVGINSSAPQAKLDVEGGAYFGNGNIGVGSSNPNASIHIEGPTTQSAIYIPSDTTAANIPAIRFGTGTPTGMAAGTYIGGSVTNGSTLMYFQGGGRFIAVMGNTPMLTLEQSTTNKMVLYANGAIDVNNAPLLLNALNGQNVGIGTSVPQAKLDVEGNVYIGDGGTAGSGNVGIGSVAPSQKVDVVGTVKATAFIGDGSGLSGVNPISGLMPGKLPKANTSSSLNDSEIYQSTGGNVGVGTTTPGGKFVVYGGNVGIGTTDPTRALDVTGNTYSSGTISSGSNINVGGDLHFSNSGAADIANTFTGATAALAITGGGNAASYLTLQSSSGAGTSDYINLTVGNNGGTEALRAVSSGNVGINSSAPQARLDVEGSVYVGNGNVGIGSSAPAYNLDVTGVVRSTGTITVDAGSGSSNAVLTLVGRNAGVGTAASVFSDWPGALVYDGQAHSFRTSGNTKVVILGSGNVGINSTAPQAKLDVEGSAYFGNGNIGVGSSVPSQKVDVVGTVKATAFVGDGTGLTGLPLGGWTQTGTNVRLTTITDNVGIGSSAPRAKLDVEGAAYFGNGNVGIGSTNPGAALDVNGTALATTFNRVTLTAPATGSTLTILDGKTLTANNTITLSAGADSKILNIGANNLTFTTTADTNVTLPTTGTLVNSAVTTLSSLTSIGSGLTGMVKSVSGALTAVTGTPGYHSRWSDANTLGNALIYDNGTNVGIGSIVPQAKLDVEGSVYIGNGNVGIGSSAPSQKIDVLGTVKATAFIGDGAGITGITGLMSGLNAGYIPKSATGTSINDSQIYQSPGSNIGIGTSTPNGKLIVYGGNVGIGSTNPNYDLTINGYTYTSQYFITGNNSLLGAGQTLRTTAGGKLTMGSGASDHVVIDTNGYVGINSTVPQARLDVEGSVYVGNGNVGIGTSLPQAMLDVAGTVTSLWFISPMHSAGSYAYSNAGYYYSNISRDSIVVGTQTAGGAYPWRIVSGNATYPDGYITFEAAGQERIRMNAAGNLGIGSSVPQAKLDVEGSAYFGNGNIGVASSAPGQKVDVVGTVRATAFVGDGAGITGLGSLLGWTKTGTNVYVTTSTDNVGIGTSVPGVKLHSQATTEQLRLGYNPTNYNAFTVGATGSLTVAATGTNPNITLTPGGTGYTLLNGNVGVSTAVPLGKLIVQGAGAAAGITFATQNSSAVRLVTMLDSGNVGINSSVPQAKLDVEGSVYIGNGNVGLGSSAPLSKLDIVGNAYINGNVGIGSSAPLRPLDVAGVAYFSGNVGIGTTAPRTKLEINNTAVFSSLYDNGDSGASKTINWNNGNKQKVTISASCTFTFTAPAGPVNLLLMAVHANNATVYTETWPTGSPGDVLWPSNTAPPLTDTANAVDIISCFYNGTDYYCQAGMNFQ